VDLWIYGWEDLWEHASLRFPNHPVIQQSIQPAIRLSRHPFHVSVVAGAPRVKLKTHGCCQPWVFVKSLRSTSTNGGVSYDDDQIDSL